MVAAIAAGIQFMVKPMSEEITNLRLENLGLQSDMRKIRKDVTTLRYDLAKAEGRIFYHRLFVTRAPQRTPMSIKKYVIVVSQDMNTKGEIVYNATSMLDCMCWAIKHMAPNGEISTNINPYYVEYWISVNGLCDWGYTINFAIDPPLIIIP